MLFLDPGSHEKGPSQFMAVQYHVHPLAKHLKRLLVSKLSEICARFEVLIQSCTAKSTTAAVPMWH